MIAARPPTNCNPAMRTLPSVTTSQPAAVNEYSFTKNEMTVRSERVYGNDVCVSLRSGLSMRFKSSPTYLNSSALAEAASVFSIVGAPSTTGKQLTFELELGFGRPTLINLVNPILKSAVLNTHDVQKARHEPHVFSLNAV